MPPPLTQWSNSMVASFCDSSFPFLPHHHNKQKQKKSKKICCVFAPTAPVSLGLARAFFFFFLRFVASCFGLFCCVSMQHSSLFLSHLLVFVGVLLCCVFSGVVGDSVHVGDDVAYEEYVDILGGTESRFDMSFGNTLPLITRPWGFNSYAPMTDNDNCYPEWWFHPSDKRFYGMRVTHQPSPWIGDYGSFLMKATMPGNASNHHDHQDQASGFSSQKSSYHPYYFKTELFSYGNNNGLLQLELAPSSHGGMMRAVFPAYIALQPGDECISADPQVRRISAVLDQDQKCHFKKMKDGAPLLFGTSIQNNGGSVDKLKHHFVMAIYKGKYGDEIPQVMSSKFGEECWVDFDPQGDNDELTVRFATSLISHEQALSNLEQEVGVTTKKTFDDIYDEAKRDWKKTLSRISIKKQMEGLSEKQAKDLLTVFYSSLYRASVFPRQLGEWDTEQKKWVHWSPYVKSTSHNDQQPQEGYLSADSGFWDAWNTIYPLLSLSNRPQLSLTIQGWLNAYKEGGWLPKWASPGYRGSMIGTMGDVAIGQAIVQQIPGFDVELAYEAIRKDAFEVPPQGLDGVGRVCLESYLQNGFVVRDANMTTGGGCYEVVSRSLNYYQSDYAVAQAAGVLNHTNDQEVLLQRSKNYSLLFNNNGGFFRSKTGINGNFTTPFDQYAWGGDYTEGGPWQYRFYVPFDGEGLKDLYENNGLNYCQILEHVQTISPTIVHIGGYYSLIHEETELSDHCWGQNAHNNQPIHHQLFMSMVDGVAGDCANMGRSWIRKVLLDMYQTGNHMFPGDEDNGEMGGWFVLSALGLYSRSPSSGVFQFTSPLFDEIELNISDNDGNRTLVVKTINNSLQNSRIVEVQWNGVTLDGGINGIEYQKIAQGGVLTYKMGE